MTNNGVIDANNVRLLDSEFLGKYVANEMAGVLRKTDELRPVFEELWRRFDGFKDGETICGCSTRTDYCETVLKRSMRSIQYILYGREEKIVAVSEKPPKPEKAKKQPAVPAHKNGCAVPALESLFADDFHTVVEHMHEEDARKLYGKSYSVDGRFNLYLRDLSEQQIRDIAARLKV